MDYKTLKIFLQQKLQEFEANTTKYYQIKDEINTKLFQFKEIKYVNQGSVIFRQIFSPKHFREYSTQMCRTFFFRLFFQKKSKTIFHRMFYF